MLKEYSLEDLVNETIESEYGREAVVKRDGNGYKVIYLNDHNTTILFPKFYGSFHEKAGEEIKVLCCIV